MLLDEICLCAAKMWLICIHVKPPSTETCIYRTVLFVSTKRSYIFIKINPRNTDGHRTHSTPTAHSHMSSTPLYGHCLSEQCLGQNIFISCEKLKERANDLSKVLSNTKSSWLGRKLKPSRYKLKSRILLSLKSVFLKHDNLSSLGFFRMNL